MIRRQRHQDKIQNSMRGCHFFENFTIDAGMTNFAAHCMMSNRNEGGKKNGML
ncbi:hypothetical protein [Anaerosinus massiliensis]|uniref:hypothetical protein n=1 Tax=Massilibacillus massiliensis TaxID=1806837 RepID=UPI0018FEF0B2|nr:hypothetical protein [Massilibacillus massiliensis]